MQVEGKPVCIYADDEFLQLLDKFAKKHHISRSSAIRMIGMSYFSKGD